MMSLHLKFILGNDDFKFVLKYLKGDKHISLYFGPKCICIFDVYVVYLTLDIICSFELTVFNLENCLHLGNIYILYI